MKNIYVGKSKIIGRGLFTTDGLMMMGKKIVMNVGNTDSIQDLFNFDYL